MISPASIPADFPKSTRLGAVSGAQPKLLVRHEAGRYVTGPDESEHRTRYEICEDLARQLAEYTLRKGSSHPEWSRDELQAKVAAGMRAKAFGWGLSAGETDWVLRRVDALTEGPTS